MNLFFYFLFFDAHYFLLAAGAGELTHWYRECKNKNHSFLINYFCLIYLSNYYIDKVFYIKKCERFMNGLPNLCLFCLPGVFRRQEEEGRDQRRLLGLQQEDPPHRLASTGQEICFTSPSGVTFVFTSLVLAHS